MATVAGLFRDRDRALKALKDLRAEGFGDDEVTIVASPTSAGIAAERAVNALDRPGDGFIDLGAAMGGQAERGFPKEERLTYEERVAAGDTLLRIEVEDGVRGARAVAILQEAGAERVAPGTIRD